MPYVRQRGNQLAIVHGERNSETGSVEQRTLFTLYSKPEALAAAGRAKVDESWLFENLLEDQYPGLKFNWKKIRAELTARAGNLPEEYPYREKRLLSDFRENLCAFGRQLVLSDPQLLRDAAGLVRDHRHELTFLRDLIDWRLKVCDGETNDYDRDNDFHWRFSLHGYRVPGEVEEMAQQHYMRGELEAAEAVFRMLIDCFEDYAEGHNYLGLIALERGKFEDAIAHFERTMKVGRRLFPPRIARKNFWRALETRPFMRGMRNLALTLVRAKRYEEALALCGRLESECGDSDTAQTHRAAVCLNLGRWQEAAACALKLRGLWPSESFVAALAFYELGSHREALEQLLRAALNHPLSARLLLEGRTPAARSHEEARDLDTGRELSLSLCGFLEKQSLASRRFFRSVLRDPRVKRLLEEVEQARWRWFGRPKSDDRSDFDRLHTMHSEAFARSTARTLLDLLPTGSVKQTRAKKHAALN